MYLIQETKYNLASKFKEFNKKYFDSELNLDFELDTKYLSNSLSLGVVKLDKDKVAYLGINTNNKLPIEVYDAILIHEMIHVYCIQKYGSEKAIEKQGHNDLFYKKRESLIKKYNLEIPVKEDISSIDKILDKLGY